MDPAVSRLSPREALRRRARRFSVNMRSKQWCDLWHMHFDWEGDGNASWANRRRYLSALFVALARARVELAAWGKPHQIFAAVHPLNSADDALYVHTPNPNGTEFPLVHAGARLLESPPSLLAGKMPRTGYAVYAVGTGDDVCYVVTPNET